MMTTWQADILFGFALINLYLVVRGLDMTARKKNPFGLTHRLSPLGIFVWGDAPIISTFWILASALALLAQDIWLFLLLFCGFWLIRGLGEVVYWLHQQFNPELGNPPHTLVGFRIYNDRSIWFAYQVWWQMVSVFALVGCIYCANAWLTG